MKNLQPITIKEITRNYIKIDSTYKSNDINMKINWIIFIVLQQMKYNRNWNILTKTKTIYMKYQIEHKQKKIYTRGLTT